MRIRYNLFVIILFVISLVSHFAEAGTLRLDTGFKPAFVFLSPGDFAYINDIKEQRDGKIPYGPGGSMTTVSWVMELLLRNMRLFKSVRILIGNPQLPENIIPLL